MKSFSNLDKDKQDELRREYKRTYLKEYQYSIHLFILYTILGICSLLGLFIIFFESYIGTILFLTSFIGTGIVLYFLYRSNQNFYKFLKRKKLKK